MMEAKEYVERRLSKPEGFDEYCKNRFDVIVFVKRDEEIFTAEQGQRKLTQKLLRKNTNFSNLYRKAYVSVDISSPNRIEQHNYLVEREINSNTFKEEITISLFNLSVLENNKVVEISWYEYGQGYQFGHRSMVAMGHYQDCYHYENNWLTNSPLAKIGLDYYTRYEMQYAYLQRHNLIQCKKRGMDKMFEDILGRGVDWRVMTKPRIKKYWINIAEHDMNFEEFKAFLILLKNGVKLTHINYDALPNINTHFIKSKHRGVSTTRIMNYLYKQEKELTYYYDYLNTLNDIGVSAATDQTFFPKSLSTAHDDAVKKFNAIKLEIKNQSYQNFLINLMVLEFSNNGLSIVVPKKLDEIVQEGKKLNHCVGSYVDRVQNKETTILFIRKTADINTPFYTMEYKNKRVVQVRGKNNANYGKDIENFIEEWKSWISKPKQKKVRTQTSQQMAMQG